MDKTKGIWARLYTWIAKHNPDFDYGTDEENILRLSKQIEAGILEADEELLEILQQIA